MKKLGILIVALLLMSSFASAGFWDLITGKATGPTIVSTACTADSDCPSGQTCGPCPSGATCTSAKICLAAAGTTPVAVPDDPNFPAGTSIIELCRYSEGPYGTSAGRGERNPRSYAKATLRLIQRDEYTFEATDIKSDGTLVLKVTKEAGASPKYGPTSLTLDTTGTINFGPAGQEIKLVKNSGITEHQYLKRVGGGNIGYNRMEGKCASFVVAPSSWENINLPFDTPFGTVTLKGTEGFVRFKNGQRYSVAAGGSLNMDSASTTVVVYAASDVASRTEVARDTVNKGESKVIGPLRVQFEGTYRDGGIWRAGIAISDKDAQVPAKASGIVARTASLTAQPVKKPGLMSRLFGAKTAANLPAAAPSTPEVAAAAAPSAPAEKTYKDTTWTCYDGSSGAEGYKNECMTLPQWQAKAKAVCEGKCNAAQTKCGVSSFTLGTECTAAAELTAPSSGRAAGVLKECSMISPLVSGKTGVNVCNEAGYPLCVFEFETNTFYLFNTNDGSCDESEGYFATMKESRPVDCSRTVRPVTISACIRSAAPYTLLTDTYTKIGTESVFCCK